MDVTIIVATHGDEAFSQQASDRAIPSAIAQTVHAPVIAAHGAGTLAEARNHAAGLAASTWLVFLDGDDELAPDYIEHLARADGDLRAPAVSYVHQGRPDPPVTFADRDIAHLNPCVIGTAVRRELFLDVGGFHEEPVYEDWALWLRCVNAGATIEHVPAAVYYAHVNPGGRNNQDSDLRRRTYREIKDRLAR